MRVRRVTGYSCSSWRRMTTARAASTRAVLGPGWVSPSAVAAARSSADLTRVMTAVTKPSSQLRRQARGLRTPTGTAVVVRPGRGQPGPVDAVAGHQLRGLRGERLGLRRGHTLGLGLRQQLAYPVKQG